MRPERSPGALTSVVRIEVYSVLVWPEFAGQCAERSHACHHEQSENGEQDGD